MALTPAAVLRQTIIEVLGDHGGALTRQEALAAMEVRLGGALSTEDRERVRTRQNEERWQNNASYERDHMKNEGLLVYRRRGVWELSDSGWTKYRQLQRAGSSTTGSDPLADFKPKNSAEYLACVRPLTLVKTRTHEQLIADFGAHVARIGWTPRTNVHPRDLEVSRQGQATFLVEAKVVYDGNATEAVRACIGQLLEYRYFFYDPASPPRLLGLFSEPVGHAYCDLLASVGVGAVWRLGHAWGATTAVRATGILG